MAMASAAGASDDDLLSHLPEGICGHILSFLPADEAARAAVLSTRWRLIFASVHTISLEQPEGARYVSSMDEDYFFEVPDRSSLNAGFTHRAAAALLSRRLAAGGLDVPLRRLRVAMFRFGGWDALMVDQC